MRTLYEQHTAFRQCLQIMPLRSDNALCLSMRKAIYSLASKRATNFYAHCAQNAKFNFFSLANTFFFGILRVACDCNFFFFCCLWSCETPRGVPQRTVGLAECAAVWHEGLENPWPTQVATAKEKSRIPLSLCMTERSPNEVVTFPKTIIAEQARRRFASTFLASRSIEHVFLV